MFIFIKSRPELKLCYIGLKTGSSGHFLEKIDVHPRMHSFDPIFMKLSQNNYIYKI